MRSREQVAEVGVAQHLSVGAQGLLQDLFAMGHEEQARPATNLAAGGTVVKRRDHGLAGTRGGHQQVAVSALFALGSQPLQHFLLVRLWLQVEESDGDGGAVPTTATGFALDRCGERLSVRCVVRVVALKLFVCPQRLEVCFGAG